MHEQASESKASLNVDQKLRIFAALEAFRSGKYPSNDQIITVIDRLAYLLPLPSEEPPSALPTPQDHAFNRLIADVRELLAAKKAWLHDKNHDDLAQDLLHELHSLKLPNRSHGGEYSDKDKGKETVLNVKTLLRVLATNSETRKLLLDLHYFAREMLANIIQHEADALRPKAHEMAALDLHAAGWDSQGQGERRRAESNARRKMARSITNVDPMTPSPGRKKKRAVDLKVEFARKDLDFADKRKKVDEELRAMQHEMSNRVPRRLRQGNGRSHSAHSSKRKRDIAVEGVEEVPSDRTEELTYRLKVVLAECQKDPDYQKSMTFILDSVEEYARHGIRSPEPDIDPADAIGSGSAERSVTSDPLLQSVLFNLTTLLERMASGKRIGLILFAINALFFEARTDDDFWKWFLHDLFPYVRRVLLRPGYILAPSDPSSDPSRSPSSPMSPGGHSTKMSGASSSTEAEQDGRRVRETGFKFYGDRYFRQFEALREVVVDWVGGFVEDQANERLWEATRRVGRDLFYADGSESTNSELVFKKGLWATVVKTVVPRLVAQVQSIPIPRVELSTPSFDLVLENILLQLDALLPSTVAIDARNSFTFSPYTTFFGIPREAHVKSPFTRDSKPPHYDAHEHEFKVTLEGIYVDLKEVGVFMSKKPSKTAKLALPERLRRRVIEESLVDLKIGGHGITVTIHVMFSRRSMDPRTTFTIKDVDVSIPDLQLHLRDLPASQSPPSRTATINGRKGNLMQFSKANSDSKSKLFVRARGKSVLRRTFKPIAVAVVKRQMKKALEEGVRDGVTRLVGTFMDLPKDEAMNDKDDIQDERASWRSRSTATLDRLRRSGDESPSPDKPWGKTDRKKVRVVFRKKEVKMRWANWDGGWVHRIRELMESPMQHFGYGEDKSDDRWKSPAFSMSRR